MVFRVCANCKRGPYPCDDYGLCRMCAASIARDAQALIAELAPLLGKHARYLDYLHTHRPDDERE